MLTLHTFHGVYKAIYKAVTNDFINLIKIRSLTCFPLLTCQLCGRWGNTIEVCTSDPRYWPMKLAI